MSYVVDDLKHLAGLKYKHEEGYIIAFRHRTVLKMDLEHTDPKYRTLFCQRRKAHVVTEKRGIIGGPLGDAYIFPTYQAAADAATGWGNTNNTDTRIIKVKTQATFEVFEDYPINLCDALAEL